MLRYLMILLYSINGVPEIISIHVAQRESKIKTQAFLFQRNQLLISLHDLFKIPGYAPQSIMNLRRAIKAQCHHCLPLHMLHHLLNLWRDVADKGICGEIQQ